MRDHHFLQLDDISFPKAFYFKQCTFSYNLKQVFSAGSAMIQILGILPVITIQS